MKVFFKSPSLIHGLINITNLDNGGKTVQVLYVLFWYVKKIINSGFLRSARTLEFLISRSR